MTEKSTLARKTPATGAFIIDHDAVITGMDAFGLRLAHDHEIEPAIALAAELTGKALAPASVVRRVHRTTGMTAWVVGDPIVGTYLFVPLSGAGEGAVRSGVFSPGDPDPAHLYAPGTLCHGIYVGVYAGQTRDARRAIMQSSVALSVGIFASVPCFARAATDDGARSMGTLGFVPIENSLPDLWVREGVSHLQGAAA